MTMHDRDFMRTFYHTAEDWQMYDGGEFGTSGRGPWWPLACILAAVVITLCAWMGWL